MYFKRNNPALAARFKKQYYTLHVIWFNLRSMRRAAPVCRFLPCTWYWILSQSKKRLLDRWRFNL